MSVLCTLLVMIAGCTHPLTRQEKKSLAKTVRVTMMMSMVGAGSGGSMAGMDDSAAGVAGVAAFGVGAGVAVRQSVVLNMDQREEELRQSDSAKRGYLIVERPSPYHLRLLTDHQASFTPGSARLTSQSRVVLNDIAAALKRHEDAKVIILGHADDGGTTSTDKQLAGYRTQAAIHYLEQHSVEAWRIEHNSKKHPINTTSGKKGLSISRRLEITFSSQLLGLKGDLDLQERDIRQFQSAKDSNLMVKRAGPDTLRLTMAHQAAFTPGSAELTSQGVTALDHLAALLTRHPYANVEIIGHANDANSPDKNMQLSEHRAKVVADQLKQGGIDALRVQSRGNGQIVYNMEGKHAQDTYRRVEIFIGNQLLNLATYVDQQEDEAFSLPSAIHGNLIIRRPAVNKLDLILAHQASFASGSTVLHPQARMALKEVVAILKRYRSSLVHVIGHAKEGASPIKDKTLSGLRARVVAAFLKQQGIASGRVDSKGVGRMLYIPINKDETDTFRRVEIMVEARHGI